MSPEEATHDFMIYLDTGCLVKLYYPEPDSHLVAARVVGKGIHPLIWFLTFPMKPEEIFGRTRIALSFDQR